MSNPVRLLTLAAVVSVMSAATAAAQTVIVRRAAPQAQVDVFINGTRAAGGQAGADGQARIVTALPPNDAGRPELDARVYIDTCGQAQRVYLSNRNMPPPAREDGCERKDVGGVFWVRQRSIVVIDVGGAIPTVLLRQGSYNPNAALKIKREVPTGLVLFAGGGWSAFEDVQLIGCGTVTDCTGDQSGLSFTVGAAYWLTRYLGGEVTFVKPAKPQYEGGGTGYDFTYELDSEIGTVAGMMAVPMGPVRIFGKAGGSYHHAVQTTVQTHEPSTITVNESTVTIPGGTQTLAVETNGWSWMFGGGIEGWVTPRVALYGEVSSAKVKGSAHKGSDLDLDERATSIVAGLRFRVF